MEIYTTGRNTSAELISHLTNGESLKAIYRVGPIQLNQGDAIHAVAEFEITTTETIKNTMCSTQIIMSTDPNAITGYPITDNNAQNITPAQHHLVIVKNGYYPVPISGVYYIMLLARSASSTGLLGLEVERNYGHLDVAVWRS